jgi:hypothetical protein
MVALVEEIAQHSESDLVPRFETRDSRHERIARGYSGIRPVTRSRKVRSRRFPSPRSSAFRIGSHRRHHRVLRTQLDHPGNQLQSSRSGQGRRSLLRHADRPF